MPRARAATMLGSWSSTKKTSDGVQPVVLQQVAEDGRVGLGQLDAARDDDAVEPVEPLEALLGVGELLGRPVAERVERDAPLVELAQDRHRRLV